MGLWLRSEVGHGHLALVPSLLGSGGERLRGRPGGVPRGREVRGSQTARALLALLQISTLDAWANVMYSSISGKRCQPMEVAGDDKPKAVVFRMLTCAGFEPLDCALAQAASLADSARPLSCALDVDLHRD